MTTRKERSVPDLKTKHEMADAARQLSASFDLIQRSVKIYIPVDWRTESPVPAPDLENRVWLPLSRDDIQDLANKRSGILFSNDGELRSFTFMLRQLASQRPTKNDSILIKTDAGLRALNSKGELVEHSGSFTPNFVRPKLNESEADKLEVFNTIAEWVGSEESAKSLLYHLATALAPGWSAVKYILLLGEGRNGKSTLLTMLKLLFGIENVSEITRQSMAERSPTCVELNDKLLNVIMDGEMSYIKDSSMEKTLIAGEDSVVRMLYESGTTRVQTNALFLEALNSEPKTRDKSSALQKRLVRFHFANVYAEDGEFFEKMSSEPILGALLALLIDHYVRRDEVAAKLTLTQDSLDLQLEQVWLGSPVLQFLEHLAANDQKALTSIKAGNATVDAFMASFKPWAETQGMHERTDGDLLTLLKTAFQIDWKTIRDQSNGKPQNKRVIKGFRPETEMALQHLMKGGPSGATAANE